MTKLVLGPLKASLNNSNCIFTSLWKGVFSSLNSIILLVLCFVFFGCAPALVNIKMKTEVMHLGLKKLPVKAALIIPEEIENYVLQSKSSDESGPLHVFPLGESLQSISKKSYSQIVEELQIVRSVPEEGLFDFSIEPKIKNFEFGYKGVEFWTKVSLSIRIYDGTKVIWEDTVVSPEKRQATYSASGHFRDAYAATGSVVASAIKSSIRGSASKILSLVEIQNIAKRAEDKIKRDSDFE